MKPPETDLSIYCLVGVYTFGMCDITRHCKIICKAYLKLFAYTQHYTLKLTMRVYITLILMIAL